MTGCLGSNVQFCYQWNRLPRFGLVGDLLRIFCVTPQPLSVRLLSDGMVGFGSLERPRMAENRTQIGHLPPAQYQ